VSILSRPFGIITLLCVLISCHPGKNEMFEPSIEDTQELLNRFRIAACRTDSLKMDSVFSKKSTSRDGFWDSMRFRIGSVSNFRGLRGFALSYKPVVDSIEARNSHAIVHFTWTAVYTETDSPRPPVSMHYYLVEEDGALLLINPIDILTQDWLLHSGKVCTFHYSPLAVDGDEFFAMRKMDSLCVELVEFFGAPPETTIDVYVTPDPQECGELILQYPSAGYASVAGDFITTIRFINPHEFVHILSMDERSRFINFAFAEGLAVGLGGTYFSSPEFAVVQSRNIAGTDIYVPIDELLFLDRYNFLDNAQVTYQEAGSFVKFLIDKYGLRELQKLEKCHKKTDDLRNCIESTFSASVKELERQWLHHIDVTAISFVASDNDQSDAESILSISDPIGDDYGGGEYVYPADSAFVIGSLDITGFDVRANNETIYFRIEFSKLGKPVIEESTGHKFLPGAMIGIKRTDGHLRKQFSGIRIAEEDGIDLRIEIGLSIVIYDSFGKAINTSGPILDSISDFGGQSISFSIPIELIGRPTSKWKWFVGSLLITDKGHDFLRSFPCPVQSGRSDFRVGGSGSADASPFVDLVLPDGIEQTDLFSNYDPQRGKPLVVPLICGANK